MAEKPIDIAGILKKFAADLPITIRGIILPSCLMAFQYDIMRWRDEDAVLADFEHLVDSAKGSSSANRWAAICGAMEFALSKAPDGLMRFVADQHPGNPTFEAMALREPLKARHWQEHADIFRRLREGPLSLESLQEWQKLHLLNNPPYIPRL